MPVSESAIDGVETGWRAHFRLPEAGKGSGIDVLREGRPEGA